MFRVAFRPEFHTHLIAPGQSKPFAMWTVTKCYHVRGMADHASPIKVDEDHGRKRLLILCPFRVPVDTYCTPFEILRAYLLELPPEAKRAREAEMRRAP